MAEDIIKEKIQLELERGRESLKSAEVNLREMLFDEAVSSSYYAMFHSVKAILLTVNQEPSTHQGVVALFSMHFIKPGLIEDEYIDLFIEAKDDREDSDYDVTRKFTKAEASDILLSAQRFISRIRKYLSINGFISNSLLELL